MRTVRVGMAINPIGKAVSKVTATARRQSPVVLGIIKPSLVPRSVPQSTGNVSKRILETENRRHHLIEAFSRSSLRQCTLVDGYLSVRIRTEQGKAHAYLVAGGGTHVAFKALLHSAGSKDILWTRLRLRVFRIRVFVQSAKNGRALIACNASSYGCFGSAPTVMPIVNSAS
jgi:hypothetical protein